MCTASSARRDVARVAIGVGIDGDRADAQPPRGRDDPAGDLAAVGDQDLGEHQTRPPRLALVQERLHAFERLLASCTVSATCSPIRSAASASCGRASICGTSSLISRLHRGRAERQLAGERRHRRVELRRLARPDRPGRCAAPSSASNMPPCISSWRARRGPTASISTGMAMPASRPLRTEVRPKRAADAATAMSQASIRPTPPPTADAMHAGDRRLGKVVDRLHRAHHGVGADPPGDGVEPGPGQHPVEVAAGREGAAFAADDQHAHRVVGGECLDGVDDGARGVARRRQFICVGRFSVSRRHAVCRPRSVQDDRSCLTSGTRRTSARADRRVQRRRQAERQHLRVSAGSITPSSHSRALA